MHQIGDPVNIRLDAVTLARLDALAAREGRSRGDVVRRLLSYALDGVTAPEPVSADGLPALSNADAEVRR